MRKQNMSSPSPVTDGKTRVRDDGHRHPQGLRLRRPRAVVARLQKEYGTFGLNWGYASSPLLVDDALYVQVLHGMKTDDPSYLLRIDAATRQDARGGWSGRPTPCASRRTRTPRPRWCDARRRNGDRGHRRRLRHRPRSRDRHASCGARAGSTPTASRSTGSSPRRWSSATLVVVPTRVKPMLAIRAGGRGDVTATHRVWSFDNGPDVPTPVTDGTHVYVVTDKGIAWCLDAKTGKVLYGPERLQPGHLQRVAGAGRRQGSTSPARRASPASTRRARLRAAGRERARRLHAQLAGDLGRPDLPAHGQRTCTRSARARRADARPSSSCTSYTSSVSCSRRYSRPPVTTGCGQLGRARRRGSVNEPFSR